ncbi:MAG: LTA synthase family protein [Clostridia bacterium]|nr:LTA synthase family protein [Clostridia bacterium]
MKKEKKAQDVKKRRPVKYDRRPAWKRILELMLMALVVTLIVEGFNQGTPARMLRYLTQRTMYFGLNWLMILTTLSITELVKHRRALSWTMSVLWCVLGFANYMICRNRTQPMVSGDLIITREIFGMITIYFSWLEIILMFAAIVAVLFGIIFLFSRTARARRVNYAFGLGSVVFMVCLTICLNTLCVSFGLIPETFGDRVNAYRDYGFATCFTFKFGSHGISKPDEYSSEAVEEIMDEIEAPAATDAPAAARFSAEDHLDQPNIVFVQLESFFDVDTVIGAEFSEDPTPVFHELIKNWPSAELYVPTIGGGTANVEFEVMSGMNMDFFGAGEAPYNTIIQEVTCETIANTLRERGYYSTAFHNNTGFFFSRNEVYANLGYDRFVPLEYMLYPEYNEVGWAHDTILTDEILRVMQGSAERDLVFAISVEAHGKYAETYVPEEGDIEILALPEEAYLAPFQNYINVLPDVDKFIGELLSTLESYDEPTVVILYGDHLPALGLDSEMLTTGDLYASRYVIWNNYGADFTAHDMEAYRLSADLLSQLGVSGGVMTKFHQSYPIDESGAEYLEKLQTLEYDLLYGEQEAYGESGAYQPTNIVYGADPIVIDSVERKYGRLLVTGDNFTEFSRIVSGENVLETIFIDKNTLAAALSEENTKLLGPSIAVAQINNDGKELGRTGEYTIE